ncbi:glycosyltransferase family 4 protein [Pseudoxanthomonas taiwanensis]|uniref:Glycosyl transferase n=1 Tax=Pseudoxanthomonas taiwanensis TaxID=176598 RepID=A0A921P085_9GAMM|nr:glycosyltransferase family 4 protein [Pseudoxanthomonas taiwanensis]KAF1690600.1 glycosyl transferase [Pseudoxanthomonas taiwanensis]
MRIAHVAPLYEAVPPRLYGGTERIVAYLADAQVELGHDVTVFASGDSHTRARLVACRDQALRLDPQPLKSDIAAHLAMLDEVRRRADEFDLIHFHVDLLHFPMFEDIAGRTVTTLHGRLDLAGLAEAYRRWSRYPLVSISDQQRAPLRFAHWIGTVHHGLPERLLTPPQAPRGDYVAFLGRISPEKRPDRAIDIARRAGMPLRIAAKVDTADSAYFRERILPMLAGGGVEFIGEIDDTRKSDFLGHAAALLFPIDWPEPFGLVMIEAMACGTPVVAWDCGSVREVVEPGVTGFIVRSEEEAVAALARVHELDRATIRRVFERRFSATTMARAYLDLYHRLVTPDAAQAASATATVARLA